MSVVGTFRSFGDARAMSAIQANSDIQFLARASRAPGRVELADQIAKRGADDAGQFLTRPALASLPQAAVKGKPRGDGTRAGLIKDIHRVDDLIIAHARAVVHASYSVV